MSVTLLSQITTGTLMGQVKINGDIVPVTRLRKIMGFVPQVRAVRVYVGSVACACACSASLPWASLLAAS